MIRALPYAALAALLFAPGARGAIDVAEIDRLAREVIETRGLPGLSIGVMSQGRVAFARGYGVASLQTKEPVTMRTQFAVGSLTKQLTCALALTLANEGRLSMDDAVERHIPGLTRGADIRLIDLGRHVSGYRDYWPLDIPTAAMRQKRASADVAREYARLPLDYEPRTRHSYSNTNYLLLGEVIEVAGKAPYADLLQERIFGPLGMADSNFGPRKTGFATGYASWAGGPWESAPREGDWWSGAAGAVWSTPSDWLKWSLAFMEGTVLSPAARALMVADTRLADGRAVGYGCGLRIGQRRGLLALTHIGLVPGFWASQTMIPATRSAIVMFGSGENLDGATSSLMRALLRMVVPADPVPTTIKGLPAIEAAKALMGQLQSGTIERAGLGADFDAWLTAERVKRLAKSLQALGDAPSTEVVFVEERGGLEHSVIRFRFPAMSILAEMYRAADGTIEQFVPYRD